MIFSAGLRLSAEYEFVIAIVCIRAAAAASRPQ